MGKPRSSIRARRLAILVFLAIVAASFTAHYVSSGRHYVRAAWITAYGTGFFTPAEVDRTVTAAKSAGLNVLIVEVRKSADAYYVSGMEPIAPEVAPGFDPLAYLIMRGHASGIKVHAWVSVYRVWRGDTTPSDPTHLANAHPDWLSRSRSGSLNAPDGIFVDPGVPEAVDHTVAVIVDIVRRYDIDGLHLDFVRYPHADWGYSDMALKRYCIETGSDDRPSPDDPRWQQWRRQQVTDSVRRIRSEVGRIKPHLVVSAATITYGDCPDSFSDTHAYKHLGQDWRLWLSEGLIDANMPMNYRDTSKPDELDEFRRWLPALRKWGGGKPVFVGLAAYMNDADAIAAQIEEVRSVGLDGFVVFCFNESGLRTTQSRDTLGRSISRTDSCWSKWDACCGAFLDGK